MTRYLYKRTRWWAVLFLPLFLRALIPVGFMPMVGPGFTLQLVVCDGYAPVPWSTAMPADMPMDMGMDMGMDMRPGSHGGVPAHDDHANCPYGSAPALGALPTLATLPPLLVPLSLKTSLAAAQVAYAEVTPRSQSPRGPPV